MPASVEERLAALELVLEVALGLLEEQDGDLFSDLKARVGASHPEDPGAQLAMAWLGDISGT